MKVFLLGAGLVATVTALIGIYQLFFNPAYKKQAKDSLAASFLTGVVCVVCLLAFGPMLLYSWWNCRLEGKLMAVAALGEKEFGLVAVIQDAEPLQHLLADPPRSVVQVLKPTEVSQELIACESRSKESNAIPRGGVTLFTTGTVSSHVARLGEFAFELERFAMYPRLSNALNDENWANGVGSMAGPSIRLQLSVLNQTAYVQVPCTDPRVLASMTECASESGICVAYARIEGSTLIFTPRKAIGKDANANRAVFEELTAKFNASLKRPKKTQSSDASLLREIVEKEVWHQWRIGSGREKGSAPLYRTKYWFV